MPPPDRHVVIARLREEIRRIEHRPARREGIAGSGLRAVDAALPGGGFPRGALSELAGGPSSGKTGVALSLLASLAPEDLFAWVDGRGELYPPGAAACGVDLARLLVVRPTPVAGQAPGGGEPWQAALWACEALLASGAFAAVVMDVIVPPRARGAEAAARRLQAAAERGGTVGLWLTGTEGAIRLPGAIRLEIASGAGGIAVRRAVEPREPFRANGGGRAA
jgi:protein ImuA